MEIGFAKSQKLMANGQQLGAIYARSRHCKFRTYRCRKVR